MRWGVVFLLIVATVGYGDSPWIPNVRVSVEAPWDTLNQGESCFDVYGDSIVSICNTAERADVPIAPYGYSFDEGNSFVQTPFTDEAAGIIWHTDPVIGVDDSGHVHMLIQYSLDEIRHYVSRDGGMSWCDTTRVTPHYGVDKPWMVVNKNEVYVVWQQTDGEIGIWCAKSTDYGGSFEASRMWERMYITALCMDESENLHLALVDWTTGYDIYYRKSTDKGETWLPEVRLSDWEYVESYGDRAPINSITARGDVVFVTWVDTRYGGWDVMGIRSTDGGTTWGTPFVVNDITEGGQCKGWGHFDEYGGLHVTYYHTPDWPTDRNSLFSFRSQYSPDSGATFNPSIRVSDGSFASLANFLGEYHICVSDSFYLYAIWTDGRNGDYNDLYFSKALLSELVVRLPLLSIYEYQWEDSGEDGHADPGDTLSLSLSLWNSGGDAGAVTVNLSSNEPVVTFIDSSADFGAILSDSIKDNRDDPFIFHVDELAAVHPCTLLVTITADSVDFSGTIPIMIGIPPVLVMDGDGGDSYEIYFTESLRRISVLFDVLDLSKGIASPYLSEYQALILLTGDNSTPIDSSDVVAIGHYLDSGGNLFITGQDAEGCVDTAFYRNYTHAEVIEDSVDRSRVFGVDDDPVTDGLRFFIAGAPGASNQVRPSIISPIGGADSIFHYHLGGCCGTKYEDGYKTASLSFGFEAISSLSIADSLMMRILKWFGVPVSVEDAVASRSSWRDGCVLEVEPNPFEKETRIECWVDVPCLLELRIYDATGRMVKELLTGPTEPGIHRVTWNGRNSDGSRLPSGVYFCRMAVRPIGVVHVPELPSTGLGTRQSTSAKKVIVLR